ncbi:MAG: extracellular solute-binding protein [Treponema sp.]
MKLKMFFSICLIFSLILISCENKSKNAAAETEKFIGTVVIYTSMYPDTIAQIRKEIEPAFPSLNITFVQGGTGVLQAKIADELAAGSKLGCDLLMVAEPSYSIELKELGLLHPYLSKYAHNLALPYDPEGYWYPVRMSNMVLAYNPQYTDQADIALGFKEFAEKDTLKGRIAMPDPDKSGSALAAVSSFDDVYGAAFFKNLGNQKIVVESASATVKKLESGEYAQVMILEESILKKRQESGSRIEVVYPADGIVAIPSPIMTIAADKCASDNIKACEAITDWFLSPAGQKTIVNGWMHSVLRNPDRYPFDSRSSSEILENKLPINWEKSYKHRQDLRNMFKSYVIPQN